MPRGMAMALIKKLFKDPTKTEPAKNFVGTFPHGQLKPSKRPTHVALAKIAAKDQRKPKSALAEALKRQPGEGMCVGQVKLRPDMSKVSGPGNDYLRNEDGTVQTRPCKKQAIRGGSVCVKHGGGSPKVKAKAQARINKMMMPFLDRLEEIAMQDEHLPAALGAVVHGLNRGLGVAGKTDIGSKEAQRPQVVVGFMVNDKQQVKVGFMSTQDTPDEDEDDAVDAEVIEDEDE